MTVQANSPQRPDDPALLERTCPDLGTYDGLRRIAPHLAESLDRYAKHRVETGGFLRACLENDFIQAASRADLENRHRLFEIASHIYNNLPAHCHGSRERVNAWLAAGREKKSTIATPNQTGGGA